MSPAQPTDLREIEFTALRLKPDALERIYATRQERFAAMLKVAPATAPHTRWLIERAQQQTTVAHSRAIRSMDLANQARGVAQRSLAAQLDDFFDRHRPNFAKGRGTDDSATTAEPDVFPDAERFVRDGFLRAQEHHPGMPVRTFGELLNEAFPDADEGRLLLLGAAANGLIEAFRVYRRVPPALLPFAYLLESLAQSLYLGIFELSGNHLARAETLKKAADLGKDAAGTVVELIAIAELVRKIASLVASIGHPPEAIATTGTTETYFEQYSALTNEWLLAAEGVSAACETAIAGAAVGGK